MTYEKPEVTTLGPAISVVQGCGKDASHTDCNQQDGTATAYEADE
jgi:hypothetical protein